MARGVTGLTLRELGQAAGGMDYAAVGEAVRRLARRVKKDHELRAAYRRTMEMLDIETGPQFFFAC